MITLNGPKDTKKDLESYSMTMKLRKELLKIVPFG